MTRSVRLPGSRRDVRERATSVALHMVRILLSGAPAPDTREQAARRLPG